MKQRILGIDAGTNSLGWAVVDYDAEKTADQYTLIDQGVNIFAEGVKIEKGIESSRAAERTDKRRLRIGYWRRKVRKINLLRILREADLCPNITDEQLKLWRKHKIYPATDEFMQWQFTDDKSDTNPYFFRNLCLTVALDMSVRQNRHIVGRAIYHLNQRRGFLSNRKESTKKSDGEVTTGISKLTQDMEKAGCEYLGQYFYRLYQRGEHIRNHYTHRIEHYERELLAICRKQGLGEELTDKLRKSIITQRPLKSQKHTVGRCVFEKNKTRCPASHPLFEQFRMHSFINNIKMRSPLDDALRPLTPDERKAVIPLFLRKSDFTFDKIAKELAGKKNTYGYYKDRQQCQYLFNYQLDTSVSACTVTFGLCEAFGVKKPKSEDEWIDAACEIYTAADSKSRLQIMNDIWHALFSFDDDEHLHTFAKEKLQMTDDEADKFVSIKLPQDYAQFSLCAIRKILPYMKRYGLIYPHAAMLANLPRALHLPQNPDDLFPTLPPDDATYIADAFRAYSDEYLPTHKNDEQRMSLERYVKTIILRHFNLPDDLRLLDCLYHHSMIDTFPKVTQEHPQKGCKLLDSPRTASLRNPMAMHSLFRMRHVINTLLEKRVIDEDTTIRIEFARELNDANRRKAIQDWQRQNEKDSNTYRDKIIEIKGAGYTPSDTEILKYRLWEEQNHICPYTGKTIGIEELLASNIYDIEHTIPRSVGGDTTAANLTVCDSHFNRTIKREKLPSQLARHELILERIEHWQEKAEDLARQIRKLNTRGVADKDKKDGIIRKRHLLQLQHEYWRGKYDRFTMTEVPEGFARRQGVDISVISRYGREYLRSLFHNVFIVKGIATAEFRRIWGLQDADTKKQRTNHCHHTIDAITIACIGKAEYDLLAQHYHRDDLHRWGLELRQEAFPKPWATFTEDVRHIADSLLVSHYTPDNMPKHTKKRDPKQKGNFQQGDTARGSLHKETYYGAIRRDGEVRYVVRRNLDALTDADIKNIVDDEVRAKVRQAADAHGSLKNAREQGIYMNREKGIRINKVRCYADSVKRPLNIRRHRDTSTKEYKQTFHVQNDTNYMMGIYAGTDAKGKEKREFELINSLDTATFFRRSNDLKDDGLLPITSPKGFPLRWKIKIGTLVLLYEKTPQEIITATAAELTRRLYKVTGLSSMVVTGNEYGRIVLTHNQEARPSTEIKQTNGAFKANDPICPARMLLHTQFRALVQNQDFTIDETGKIQFPAL